MMSIEKIRNYFDRPFPLITSTGEKWWTSTRIGLFIFLFLYGFQPFRLSSYVHVLPIALGYGLIAFFCTALFLFLIPLLFPKYFDEETWTVKKELIYKISPVVLIGFSNTIYSMCIHLLDSFWKSFLYFEVCTLAVGIFPLTYFVYLIERRSTKKYEKLSTGITSCSQPNKKTKTIEPIHLTASNHTVELSLNPKQLYYVQSSSNYVEIIYWKDDKFHTQLMRNTISNIEYQLQSSDIFYRCHKSYIVNLTHIQKITGNARGLKIHFEGLDRNIPVSRSNNEVLKQLLADNI